MARVIPSRRFAAATLVVGITLVVTGFVGGPAHLGASEPSVFGPGFDTYLNANRRGLGPDDVHGGGTCPSDPSVEGMTAWHFVLPGSDHDFASLDVAFTLEGTNVTLTGLTPKTTAEWASFDPSVNFIADPSLKHAYVYTNGSGTVRDTAAQVNPDETMSAFQLSHVCVGEGATTTTYGPTTTTTQPTTTTTEGTTTTQPTTTTTEATTTTTEGTTTTQPTTTTTEATTTTTEGTTTTQPTTTTTEATTTTTEGTTTTEATTSTTEATTSTTEATTSTTEGTTTTTEGTTTTSILGSSTSNPTTTSVTVAGNVITPNLPKTGAPDRTFALMGAALTLAGGAMLIVRRRLLKRSSANSG